MVTQTKAIKWKLRLPTFCLFFLFLPLFLFLSLPRNRDITIRGRDIEGVIKQYSSMVKPAYCNYIAPAMAHADIIVPRGGDNKVAIQLIVQHVHSQLQLVRFVWFCCVLFWHFNWRHFIFISSLCLLTVKKALHVLQIVKYIATRQSISTVLNRLNRFHKVQSPKWLKIDSASVNSISFSIVNREDLS